MRLAYMALLANSKDGATTRGSRGKEVCAGRREHKLLGKREAANRGSELEATAALIRDALIAVIRRAGIVAHLHE